jgi:Caspase domain/Agenet domain
MRRLLATLMICALTLGAVPASAASQLELGRTWVFVVGLLQWHDKASYASFPQANRRDAQLVELLKRRGVPADHVVYLQDRNATRKRVTQELTKLLAHTQERDELVLYFCGHGVRDDDGRGYFVTYDATDDYATTAWPMQSIVDSIRAHFRGTQALLVADCCCSGTLAQAVKASTGRTQIACLTSSSANIVSTGAWTFTEAILEGLSGSPAVDLNHDGVITFDELSRYARTEMAFADEQRSARGMTQGYDFNRVMARVSRPATTRLGEHTEARCDGEWFKARILEARAKQVKVHFYGYETSDDCWVSVADLKMPKPTVYKPGSRVEVESEKQWYPATILEQEDGVHKIHYEGYAATSDEWVASSRIRAAR